MKFEWDPYKANLNLRKHGVSFEEAATALLDGLSTTAPDPDHSESENRFVTFGRSAKGRLLAVSNTQRGEFVRIISARPATKQEREVYEEH
ncbi:MAG: BrnT family toxin [Acidobacteriota bacterium]